jgi:gentisate 1,2-dioxygenase
MSNYISAYEYESNVNPAMKAIPITSKNISEVPYGISLLDCSNDYHADYPATSPNLLAHFIRLNGNEEILDNVSSSSHFFYIIEGKGEISVDDLKWEVSKGDIFITPCFKKQLKIRNGYNEKELQMYYVNDSPLLHYLGSTPTTPTFQSAIYSHEFLWTKLQELSNSENNRKGILLSNLDTETLGINTITPVLWALYNELPAHTRQRPHRHNSVALDFCISSPDDGKVYTLISEELDEQGELVNPVKVEWRTSEMFITPPGLWHSHHNEGDTNAYVLPIQDAGLLLYQRILGIVLN